MILPLKNTEGHRIVTEWLSSQKLQPFSFQEETWQYIIDGKSGLVNAPTGCGKTYSVFLGSLIQFINLHPDDFRKRKNSGLQLLWITPLRALAKDIARAMEEAIAGLEMNWKTGVRNGDTQTAERSRQKKQMPEVLIITPESLHLLLAQKGYAELFSSLKIIAVDEWHELLGSKRGVQVELAISRIRGCRAQFTNEPLQVWGISATLGNMEEALAVLLSPLNQKGKMVRAGTKKEVYKKHYAASEYKLNARRSFLKKETVGKGMIIESILPDEIEKYPWAGHLGIKLIHKVIPIIRNSRTTLIFINTRGMSETWYQKLLDECPDLAGAIALHHGSVDRELRYWVEENLHSGKLKAVVCTASLDLGVDFRPVETVIQVGSPKGVARFLQRAGRSGHSFDTESKIYFLPTHSLELLEAAALKTAISRNFIESRMPMVLCYDVLIQFLNTIAISDGFDPGRIFKEVSSTYCFKDMTADEWDHIIHFITSGGNALQQYDDYKKLEWENGSYKINDRHIARRHRMNIGTIVSEAMLKVKYVGGGYVGVIEEYFISRLQPGDVFTLAGRNLEFVMIKDTTVMVKRSSAKRSIVPSWFGGRMPLSANLGKVLRETLTSVKSEKQISGSDPTLSNTYSESPELKALLPLFELQQQLSYIPKENELLIEQIETEDGFHLFVYPFEGRLVHEAMAALLAYRISLQTPITFSFAMNDYSFELLSDRPVPVDDSNVYELFSPENLMEDIQRSINSTEMAKRKFRDIAVIGGLIFQGFPGEQKKARHLQNSASLLFNVLSEYEPDNLLLRQSYTEVMEQQMEEARLRDTLKRIQGSKIIIRFPEQLTPFCFPVKVDSMREDLSSEKLEDRIHKMIMQYEI